MHILCLSMHYRNPDCAATTRLYTLLKHLVQHHEVTLLTTSGWHHQRITQRFDWVPPGTRVHTLDVRYENRMSVLQRLYPFALYPLWALWKSLRLPRPDVVYSVSTPLSTAWAADRIAAWYDRPWVFEVRDLWPDFPIQMGAIRSRLLQRRLYALEERLYRRTAHILPASPDMTRAVLDRQVAPSKVTTLVTGTDLDLADAGGPDTAHLRQAHRLGDRTVILYAGTFGRANDIPTLLQAARLLSHRKDLLFLFLGSGYHAPMLHEASAALPNVRVLPPVPRHEIFGWFRLAALSLVSFIDLPVLAANSPAKFFDSLAVGTPVIVTNPGWTKALVEAHRCGWYVPATDPGALAERITGLLTAPDRLREAGANGMRLAHEQFDRDRIARDVERILIDTASTARPGRGRRPRP